MQACQDVGMNKAVSIPLVDIIHVLPNQKSAGFHSRICMFMNWLDNMLDSIGKLCWIFLSNI